MLNKRKRLNMNPTKINNYNKFLSTLDQIPSSLNKPQENLNKTVDFKKNTDDEIKSEIDKLIENITNNFSLNYSSNNFTGKNYNDNITLLINDPNYYKDFINKKYKYISKNVESPEPPIEIKETINM
jgi:hypothetical protein